MKPTATLFGSLAIISVSLFGLVGTSVAGGTVLVVQPHTQTYFSETAINTFSNKGYDVGNIVPGTPDGSILDVIFLNSYDVLLFGGHGAPNGSIILGKVYSNPTMRDDDIGTLEDTKSYLTQGDLSGCVMETGPGQPDEYYICISKTLADEYFDANTRDLAVISTCYGSSAGSFDAQCKMDGSQVQNMNVLRWQRRPIEALGVERERELVVAELSHPLERDGLYASRLYCGVDMLRGKRYTTRTLPGRQP